MTGRVQGQVALITGAARGQGRSHAVRLAEEGADIIAVDICRQIDSVPFPMATSTDLAETVRLVEGLDRRIVAFEADVRDYDALKGAVDAGVAELGRLDIVAINAGIVSYGRTEEISEEAWRDTLDVNLTGAWHTAKAVIGHMKSAGRGGSIVLTSSYAGLNGGENAIHYTSSKHGVVGLMRSLALELAPYSIRVNSVHPGNIDTDMVNHVGMYRLFRPDLEDPSREDFLEVAVTLPALPVALLDPVDISNAVLFLASDEARYITGVTLPVDAGWNVK
jgi:(+)-trans-carveol dehydrogenase